MTLRIYANARRLFGSKLMDWNADFMRCALPPAAYIPNIEVDTSITSIGTLQADVALTAQFVTSDGWMSCDTIYIPLAPANVILSRLTIYRQSDGVLVFDLAFPAVTLTSPGPIILKSSINAKGLARL